MITRPINCILTVVFYSKGPITEQYVMILSWLYSGKDPHVKHSYFFMVNMDIVTYANLILHNLFNFQL